MLIVLNAGPICSAAIAGTLDHAKIALHAKVHALKGTCSEENPNASGIPCSDYVTEWPLWSPTDVYLVVVRGDSSAGVSGLECGIDYNGTATYGADIVIWGACANQQFLTGSWPDAGTGISLSWDTPDNCQRTVIESDGVHAVAGAFYVYAYDDDLLQITANPTATPTLAVVDCSASVTDLNPSQDAGAVGFGATSGVDPCTPRTWYVPGDAPTIQAGVDSAWSGDSVVLTEALYTGTGNRGIDVVDKAITIRSQSGDPTDCVLDCEHITRGFRFAGSIGNDTVLEGITIINGWQGWGGGIYCNACSPLIRDCVIRNCVSSGRAGGVELGDQTAVLEDCVVADNQAELGGGGVYAWGSTTITGCTIVRNSTPSYGAGVAQLEETTTLENSIVAFNRGSEGVKTAPGHTTTLACCAVYDNDGGDWVGEIAGQDSLNGNLHVDPLFCDPGDGDYALRSNSPCLAANSGGCGLIGALDEGCALAPEPLITLIEDIPNDQGRRVRIAWIGSTYDAVGQAYTIGSYAVYRRVDDLPPLSAPGRAETAGALIYPPGTWDFVADVPARGEADYSTVVETLCDSTITAGPCLSAFFVSAVTTMPPLVFDSAPDSGYSVDNLAPDPPQSLLYHVPGSLTWEESAAEDFDHFTVYGSALDTWDETAAVVGYTADPFYGVSGSPYAYYHVTVVDFAGNESGAASTQSQVGLPDPAGIPTAFALERCRPNPFRTASTVVFDLPRDSVIRLRVFDVRGRVVALVTNREYPAGRHAVAWDGRTDRGDVLSPGVYFISLEAEEFKATQKVILIR